MVNLNDIRRLHSFPMATDSEAPDVRIRRELVVKLIGGLDVNLTNSAHFSYKGPVYIKDIYFPSYHDAFFIQDLHVVEGEFMVGIDDKMIEDLHGE